MGKALGVITAVAVLGAASVASASVDTSPRPGGVYRLKPGIYVRRGVDCSSPPNAAILRYDGKGLSSPHSRACRVRVVSRRGGRFVVNQSCVGAGAGPVARFSERQIVTVSDALTFSLRTRGPASTYRYCPIGMLPTEFRSYAR